MSEQSQTFIAKSTIKAADLEHRRKINFNIARYNAVVPAGKQQFANLHRARECAKNIKWRAIENRNPLPNGEGKKHFVTQQAVPVDRIDELVDSKAAPKPLSLKAHRFQQKSPLPS